MRVFMDQRPRVRREIHVIPAEDTKRRIVHACPEKIVVNVFHQDHFAGMYMLRVSDTLNESPNAVSAIEGTERASANSGDRRNEVEQRQYSGDRSSGPTPLPGNRQCVS